MGSDEGHQLPIRVITEMAWLALFARNMFLPVTDQEALLRHVPGFTVISAPGFHSRPEIDETRSDLHPDPLRRKEC